MVETFLRTTSCGCSCVIIHNNLYIVHQCNLFCKNAKIYIAQSCSYEYNIIHSRSRNASCLNPSCLLPPINGDSMLAYCCTQEIMGSWQKIYRKVYLDPSYNSIVILIVDKNDLYLPRKKWLCVKKFRLYSSRWEEGLIHLIPTKK